jgi:hypothetical protein
VVFFPLAPQEFSNQPALPAVSHVLQLGPRSREINSQRKTRMHRSQQAAARYSGFPSILHRRRPAPVSATPRSPASHKSCGKLRVTYIRAIRQQIVSYAYGCDALAEDGDLRPNSSSSLAAARSSPARNPARAIFGNESLAVPATPLRPSASRPPCRPAQDQAALLHTKIWRPIPRAGWRRTWKESRGEGGGAGCGEGADKKEACSGAGVMNTTKYLLSGVTL